MKIQRFSVFYQNKTILAKLVQCLHILSGEHLSQSAQDYLFLCELVVLCPSGGSSLNF